MTIANREDISIRCLSNCGLKTPCFTHDQIACIQDILINRIGTIRVIIAEASELCRTKEDMLEYLKKSLKSIDELIFWCRNIGNNCLNSSNGLNG